MEFRKAFTLIEIVAVMIIVSILAVIGIHSYYSTIEDINKQNIEHNLMSIFNAEQAYYRIHKYYCGHSTTPGIPSGCTGTMWTSTQNINQALGTNLPSPVNYPEDVSYYCYASPSAFGCVAGTIGTTSFPNDIFFTIINNQSILDNGGLCGIPPYTGAPYCRHQTTWQAYTCP